MGKRVRTRTLILLGTLFAAVPGFLSAQTCSNDGTLIFTSGSVIELEDATGDNILDGNDNTKDKDGKDGKDGLDRVEELDPTPPLNSTSLGSTLIIEGIELDDYPDLPLGSGFDREADHIWEVSYAQGEHVFDKRKDLEVEVTMTIPGDEATQGPSRVTLVAEHDHYHEDWYPGTNSLRELRGTINFRYEDLQNLARSGVHRAQMTLCVEVSGQSN